MRYFLFRKHSCYFLRTPNKALVQKSTQPTARIPLQFIAHSPTPAPTRAELSQPAYDTHFSAERRPAGPGGDPENLPVHPGRPIDTCVSSVRASRAQIIRFGLTRLTFRTTTICPLLFLSCQTLIMIDDHDKNHFFLQHLGY